VSIQSAIKSLSSEAVAVIGAALFFTTSANAQVPAEPKKPRITKVEPARAGLGDEIEVHVTDFPKGQSAQQKWILFLDGVPLNGLHPENSDFEDGKIKFYLRRVEHSVDSWRILCRGWVWSRPVRVALGTEDGGIDKAIAKLDSGFELIVVPQGWKFNISIVIALVVVVSVLLLGSKTNLLREWPGQKTANVTPPYSLGKVQWAWWLVLILYAYLAIGLVTWDYYSTFSTSALALLGISTGTALGSVMINSTAAVQSRAEKESLERDVAGLQAQVAQPDAVGNMGEPQRMRTESEQKSGRLETVKMKLTQRSENFICDILSDPQGICLHRFQIVAWTIVLGLVFVIGVWNDKAMPDFSPTLLALMGVSSGTYLAFKVPEARA
jgi:hypothetical protein